MQGWRLIFVRILLLVTLNRNFLFQLNVMGGILGCSYAVHNLSSGKGAPLDLWFGLVIVGISHFFRIIVHPSEWQNALWAVKLRRVITTPLLCCLFLLNSMKTFLKRGEMAKAKGQHFKMDFKRISPAWVWSFFCNLKAEVAPSPWNEILALLHGKENWSPQRSWDTQVPWKGSLRQRINPSLNLY